MQRKLWWKLGSLLVGILFLIQLMGCNNTLAVDESKQNKSEAVSNRIGIVDLEELKAVHPDAEVLEELNKQIKDSQINLEEQQGFLNLTSQNREEHLQSINEQISKRLQDIKSGYQTKIEERIEKTKEELSAYKESLKQEIKEKFEQKKREIRAGLDQKIDKRKEKQNKELQNYQQKLNKEYNRKILNLRLKLQMLDLSSEERKEYQQQLAELEAERKEKLANKKEELQKKLQEYAAEQQKEAEEKLRSYHQKLTKKMQQKIKNKQEEANKELQNYIKEQNQFLQQEIETKREDLTAKLENTIVETEEKLDKNITERNEELAVNLEKLKEDRNRLEKKINKDIKEKIAEVAEDKGLGVVLTDYSSSLSATNITEDVAVKLKE